MNNEEFLEHFGVKGMKWGVRKEERRIKNFDKAFEKFPNKSYVKRDLLQIAESAANKDIYELNKKYVGEEQMFGPVPVMPIKYYDEAEVIINKHLEEVSSRFVNASGTRRLKAHLETEDGTGYETLVVTTEALKHDIFSGKIVIPLTKDANGFIVDLKFPEEVLDLLEDSLEQDALTPQEKFLSHYGVVGMKWGVRKLRNRSASKVAKKQTRDRFASEEGREAMRILTKQKKFGTGSLTNQELQVVNARIRLEQDFAKNFPGPKSTLQMGQDFAKKFISVVDTAGNSVKAADKAKKILKGEYLMSAEAKDKAKLKAIADAVGTP